MKILKKLLVAALFVKLSVEQAPEAKSGCESCKVAVTDFLTEWAALEPTLAAYLPVYLCKGFQLAEVCRQLVAQGLSRVSQSLNNTSPEEACDRWCEGLPVRTRRSGGLS